MFTLANFSQKQSTDNTILPESVRTGGCTGSTVPASGSIHRSAAEAGCARALPVGKPAAECRRGGEGGDAAVSI